MIELYIYLALFGILLMALSMLFAFGLTLRNISRLMFRDDEDAHS